MSRKTNLMGLACALATAVACSGTPQTPTSASAALGTDAAVNADGSTLKITAPTDLSPSGNETITTRRPTLRFSNPAGRFVGVGFAYEIEVRSEDGNLAYSQVIGETPGQSQHEIPFELEYEGWYQWRVRGRLGDQAGPWSTNVAWFRTPDRPRGPTPGPGPGREGLGFPVPAECRSGGVACVFAVAVQSSEWRLCAAGRGVGCHRFSRQVIFAMNSFDPNWKAIQAAPGGQSCNCFGCGPSDGTMFREDTAVYGGRQVFDMIVGAGGPAPSVNWSLVPGPRPGDIPADAPLCP